MAASASSEFNYMAVGYEDGGVELLRCSNLMVDVSFHPFKVVNCLSPSSLLDSCALLLLLLLSPFLFFFLF